MRKPLLVVAAALAMTLTSCIIYSEAYFSDIKPGTSLSHLTKLIGSPDRKVGEITTAVGQRVSVMEYERWTKEREGLLSFCWPYEHKRFWFYIVDGRYATFSLQKEWRVVEKELYGTDFPALPEMPADTAPDTSRLENN